MSFHLFVSNISEYIADCLDTAAGMSMLGRIFD